MIPTLLLCGYLIAHYTIIMQTKKQSLIEVVISTLIGLITGFIVQIIIYPIFNIEVSFIQNIYITGIFVVVGIIKSYLVRRLFNRIFK